MADLKGERTIRFDEPDLQICNNKIKTSKYNPFNFFCKNILEQFSRLANVYFLVKHHEYIHIKIYFPKII